MSWSLDDWNVTENWVKTYPAGRVCDREGCATILSKFNSHTTCEACQPKPDFLSYLGRRFKRCVECGEIAGRRGDAGRSYICPSCTKVLTDALLLGSKYCPTCHLPKPKSSDHFGRDIHQDDGLNRVCKACRSERARERYASDPEFREKRKAHSRKAAS